MLISEFSITLDEPSQVEKSTNDTYAQQVATFT